MKARVPQMRSGYVAEHGCSGGIVVALTLVALTLDFRLAL